jgi:ubiquinone/menaquinone biosynthesis C-methylase UbiE
MKKIKEKNVQAFNADIKNRGGYQYTNFGKYSAYIATKRQTKEIIKFLKKYAGKSPTILDVGCGDGVFTLEIYNLTKPKKIIGFDRAYSAINVASKSIKHKERNAISFQVGDVYEAHKLFKKDSFDIIVIRGVLHHLYQPQEAIKSLSLLSKKIIVLEPNGFNPLLKVIEKISPYHRKHEEKSYYPPKLNRWFINNGFIVKEQLFFSIVPYFCPEIIAKLLKSVERFIEKLPILHIFICGTNIIYYERKN